MRYGEARSSEYRIFVHGLNVTGFVREWDRQWSSESNAPSQLTIVLNNPMTGSGRGGQFGPSPLIYQDFDLDAYYTQGSGSAGGNASEGAGVANGPSVQPSSGGPGSPMPAKDPLISARDIFGYNQHPIKTAIVQSRQDAKRTGAFDQLASRLATRVAEVGALAVGDTSAAQAVLRSALDFDQRLSDDPEGALSGVVVPGQAIFRANDAVRLFVRCSEDPTRWFYEFTGVVDGVAETEIAEGDGTVTLICEGVLRPLRDSRFASNPGYGQARLNQGVAGDLVLRTWADDESGFTNLTLPEVALTLAFGPVPFNEAGEPAAQLGGLQSGQVPSPKELKIFRTLRSASIDGFEKAYTFPVSAASAGTFSYAKSAVFVLGSGDSESPATTTTARDESPSQRYADRIVRLRGQDTFARYQAIVDTEVRVGDLVNLLAAGASPPQGFDPQLAEDLTIDDVVDTIGQNPHLYPCEGNAVYFTSPAALDATSNLGLINRIPGGSADAAPNFRTRLSALLGMAGRVDFKVMDTPKGDLVVEMPMYHLHPDDFGVRAVAAEGVPEPGQRVGPTASARRRLAGAGLAGLNARGPFGSRFRLDLMDSSGITVSVDAAQVKTIITCVYNPAAAGYKIADNQQLLPIVGPVQVPEKGTEFTDPLIQRFGIRATEANPTLIVTSRDAARAYAQMSLSKINAQATTMSPATIRLRTGLWPNRPYLVERRASDLVACSETVDLSGAGGGVTPAPSASTSIGFRYVKHWTGLYDKDKGNRKIFGLFGLLDGDPFDYAKFNQISSPDTQTTAPRKRRRKGPGA